MAARTDSRPDTTDADLPDTFTRGQRYPLGQRIGPVTPEGALITAALIAFIRKRLAEPDAATSSDKAA